ncbi:MAG: DinB family protein [Ignavibacteria bacterium]
METLLKEVMWKQFGASIDMFENAVRACPEDLWDADSKYWYIVYHTLFFLDYYLSTDPDNFSPPTPFTLSEFDSEGEMPERVFSKEEMMTYLNHCRNKCHVLITGLNADTAMNRWKNEYRDYSIHEILLYNMRHVQHHGAQLNLLLRQNGGEVPDWVSQTKIKL